MIDQATGELLLRLTIRVAVACYVCRIVLQIDGRFRSSSTAQCVSWAVGCLFYLLHVAIAFAFVHDWSHTSALEHTASETARMTGLRRGEGLWINYLFSAVWIADVARICIARVRGQSTNVRVDYLAACFFAFIFFNATVVFGPAFYRWLAFPIGLLLTLVWKRSSRTQSRSIE